MIQSKNKNDFVVKKKGVKSKINEYCVEFYCKNWEKSKQKRRNFGK